MSATSHSRAAGAALASLLLIILSALAACSDSLTITDPAGSVPGHGLRIVAADAIGSRAEGGDNAGPLSNELIHNWWMAFVADGRTVAVTPVVTAADGGVASDILENFSVVPGTYTVYAFANISPEELTAQTGASAVPGDEATFDTSTFPDLTRPEAGTLIPMTGKGEAVVGDDGTMPDLTVNVTRIVGKVTLSLNNTSSAAVTLRSLIFGPVSDGGEVALMPRDGEIAPSHAPAYVDVPLPAEGVTVAAGTTSEALGMYVRESSNDDGGRFRVSAVIERDGSDEAETIETFLPEAYTSVARNEWMDIQLAVNDYRFTAEVDVDSPTDCPYTTSTDPNGLRNIYFYTSGAFTIVPTLSLATEPTTPLAGITATLIGTEVTGVDGNPVPDGLFADGGEPAQAGTNVVGIIGDVMGKADLRLTFRVTGTLDDGTDYNNTYTRTVRLDNDRRRTLSLFDTGTGSPNNISNGPSWTSPGISMGSRDVKVRITSNTNGNNINRFTWLGPNASGGSSTGGRISFRNDNYTIAPVDNSGNPLSDCYISQITFLVQSWYDNDNGNPPFTITSWAATTFADMPEGWIPEGLCGDKENNSDGSTVAIGPSDVMYTYGLADFAEAGTHEATFAWSSGQYRLNCLGVDLLDQDGNRVAYDYHFGYAMNTYYGDDFRTTYTLEVPSAGHYIIRYFVTRREDDTTVKDFDSTGTITWTPSTPTWTNSGSEKFHACSLNGRFLAIPTGAAGNNYSRARTVTVEGSPDRPFIFDVRGQWMLFWKYDVELTRKKP